MPNNQVTYPLDMSGNNPLSLVQNELHTVSESHFRDYYFIVPIFSPFYVDNFSLVLSNNGSDTVLTEDVDYSFALEYVTGTRTTGKAMYGAVTLHNLNLNGILKMTYQTLGGDQVADRLEVLTVLADKVYNPRTTIWDIVTNVPTALPPTPHYQDYDQFLGQEAVVQALGQIRDAILQNSTLTTQELSNFIGHLNIGSLAGYLSLSGGVMTGPLILSSNPSEPLQAVSKQYVDGLIMDTSQFTSLLSTYATTVYVDQQNALKLSKSGGVMTGSLSLSSNPTEPSHAVTKDYADTIQQNLQTQLTQIQSNLSSVTIDPVTKAYVDDKFNDIMALISSLT